MKNALRVEVEPLSQQRWAKIERTIFAELQNDPLPGVQPSERRATVAGPGLWLAAAALVSVLAVVGLGFRGMSDGERVAEPSRITTGESSSHVALPGLTLDVEPQSVVVVSADTHHGRLLVLDRGAILCDVAPRANDAPLVVQAGATRVKVVGTRFTVVRHGESAQVAVHEGVVEVTSAGHTVRVGAGENWPRGLARLDDPSPDTGSEVGSVEDPADADPVPARRRDAVQTAPSEQVEPVPDTIATEEVDDVRTESSVSKRRPARVRRPGRSAPESSAEPPERHTSTSDRDAPVVVREEPNRSAQSIFEEATTLERREPGRASQLYRSLESGTDSWAQNALYAHGRLEAARGNRGAARRLLERYLERFPRGSNAEDARAMLRKLR